MATERQDLLQMLLTNADQRRISTQAPVFGVTEQPDIPYLTEEGTVQLMDLYRPDDTPDTLPVILDVHGGAWGFGSRESNRNYCMYLASQGFAVVNIDYARAQYNDLRRQLSDILRACETVLQNADEFALDTNNLFLCGNSAGAHLAMLSYIVNFSPTLRTIYDLPQTDLPIRAMGLVTPVTDLDFFKDSVLPQMRHFAARLFGDPPKQSPYFYCASIADVLRTSTKMPPVYLLGSEDDFFKSQSLQLDHLLTKRNVEHTFRYCAAGKDCALSHSFSVFFPEYTQSVAVNQEMLAFFSSKMQ